MSDHGCVLKVDRINKMNRIYLSCSILELFKSCLKSDGEVILAGETRKSSMDFYRELESAFSIRVLKKSLRSENDKVSIYLFRMTLKG